MGSQGDRRPPTYCRCHHHSSFRSRRSSSYLRFRRLPYPQLRQPRPLTPSHRRPRNTQGQLRPTPHRSRARVEKTHAPPVLARPCCGLRTIEGETFPSGATQVLTRRTKCELRALRTKGDHPPQAPDEARCVRRANTDTPLREVGRPSTPPGSARRDRSRPKSGFEPKALARRARPR